ncbi:hypothetical protein CEXT_613131 [Caerostris extrusa]|uniref:Uncharacterized protein n=1 Tax=Caerostris extrusa TaxID=172846 RepID=A0AAV4RPU7_CAEEX|nr:hypothetical protein CEXT_613131 [Caerostris extrusa]
MPAVVDRAYHPVFIISVLPKSSKGAYRFLVLGVYKSSASCRVRIIRSLPFETAYRTFEEEKKNDSHLRYWFCWKLSLCLYGKWHCSVEISLSALRDCQSATCITVDITSEQFTAKNVRANRWAFRNLSKLSFPYCGYNRLESVRAVIKRLYDEKDRGRGLYVAVKGDEIKDFFVSCGLPVCEMKIKVLGDVTPKYTDLYELSQQVPVSCNNHVNGDDFLLTNKRISFTFARYLESLEEDQRQMNDERLS